MTAGAAVQKLMMKLENEQEILMHVADMIIKTFVAESALLRVMSLAEKQGEQAISFEVDILRVYLYDVADGIAKDGKDAVNSFMEGDEQRMLMTGLKRFTKTNPFNVKEARRRIAAKIISEGKYNL